MSRRRPLKCLGRLQDINRRIEDAIDSTAKGANLAMRAAIAGKSRGATISTGFPTGMPVSLRIRSASAITTDGAMTTSSC